MICPNCGNQAQETALFCDQCGTRLQTPAAETPAVAAKTPAAAPAEADTEGIQCTSCGHTNVPGEMFCDHCGAALEALAPEAPPVSEVSESQETLAAGAPAPAAPAAVPTAGPTCPACGVTVTAEDEYCDNCGAALRAAAAAPTAAPASSPAGPRLIVADTGAEIPLPGNEEILVGREDPISGVFPDIDLTPHGGEEGGVSRKHLRIRKQNGHFVVEDLNSTNFTWVNQQRLPPGTPQVVQDGAELRLGRVRLILKIQ